MARTPLPLLTNVQARRLEQLMLQHYAIGWPQMLENAGRGLAHLACELLDGEIVDRPIVVLAGRGPNGGGWLAAARHLINGGASVQIVCSYAATEYRGAPGQQLAALQAMGAPLAWAEDGWELPPCDLLIDAVIGYGLARQPTSGPARNLIALANSNPAPILSLDLPSGVDSEGGRLYEPHIRAAATLSLALPKAGLRQPLAAAACGDLYLTGIGAPAALFAELGLDAPPPFGCNPVVPLCVEGGEVWFKE